MDEPAGDASGAGPPRGVDGARAAASTDIALPGLTLDDGGTHPTVPVGINAMVSPVTAARIAQATPASTIRVYGYQWRRFAAWCDEQGRTAVPCSDATLAEYVSALVTDGAGVPTIDQAVAAIARLHRDRRLPAPDTRAALLVRRTHRRQRADTGGRVRQAPPIAREQLRAMVAACPDTVLGARDRALLTLGVTMMARRSELAALDRADLAEVEEGMLVHVRKSKTDQDAVGVEVAIPYSSHLGTCAVRQVRAWVTVLADHGILDGPLLRAVDRHGRVSDRRMSGDGINRAVRAAAARAHLPGADTYTGHSLRAGGATAAARAGARDSAIASQGRWSHNSPVVGRYIRDVERWKDNPMTGAL